MNTIILLRHGLRLSHNEDTALSPEGIVQAEKTGRYLLGTNFTHMYISPTNRTQQTAEHINAVLNLPCSFDARLKERMEFIPGSTTFENFLVEWDRSTVDRKYQSPFGDSSQKAGERVISLFDELDDDKTYLLISHGGTIGDVVQNLFPNETLPFRSNSSQTIRWLEIMECSITEIEYSKKNPEQQKLVRVNDIGHL